MFYRSFTLLAVVGVFACGPGQARADVVIRAEEAAVRTEGGPHAGGGWNLWSSGRVGQPLRCTSPGTYTVVVRAWGSPAAGVWPEMALLIDGRTIRTATVEHRTPEDYRFEVELKTGIHEIAVAFLNDAVVGQEDRNLYLDRLTIVPPSGAADPVPVDKRELAQAAEQREQQIVDATQASIDEHRKAQAVLRVLDRSGRPLPGTKVSVEQTGHDFLFGCNIYMFDRFRDEARDAAYKQRFAELFNYATLGFYWRSYEPQRGTPNYAYTDQVVAWCQDHGIRMKGHPLLWGAQAGVPTWSQGQPSAEIQRQRVTEIMQRYRGKIEFWEVVNEPAHVAEPKIDQPYRWAREAGPDDCLIINDYHVLADGCPAFFRLLTAAKQQQVPFDGIGIQAHEPRTMRFPLDRVQEILDQYATFGKGLHITEFTPASSGQTITGSHRDGVWDEEAQAEYAVKFYRVCFAHPAVQAITWWDLCDHGSWLPGGGMLRADMSPKPVYEQLRRLIHEEWQTSTTGVTDREGRFALRGFLGEYRLTIRTPDGEIEREVKLVRDGPSEIVVRLASPSSP